MNQKSSKRDIISLLQEKNMTWTELLSALNISKPALFNALKPLQESGFIKKKFDEEKGKITYTLNKELVEARRGNVPKKKKGFSSVVDLFVSIAIDGGLMKAIQDSHNLNKKMVWDKHDIKHLIKGMADCSEHFHSDDAKVMSLKLKKKS